MEIRTVETNFKVDGRILEGYAIRFNSLSNVMYEKGRFFREVIKPEAITQELINSSDIRFLIDHNKERLVARCRNGQGSLAVEVRTEGVYFLFEVPNTTDGNDLYELVKRGDISQCSFGFAIAEGGETWDFSDKDFPIRYITKISLLNDLTATPLPAYSETEISARSIEEMMPEEETHTTTEAETETTTEPAEETPATTEPAVEETEVETETTTEPAVEETNTTTEPAVEENSCSWKEDLEKYRKRI